LRQVFNDADAEVLRPNIAPGPPLHVWHVNPKHCSRKFALANVGWFSYIDAFTIRNIEPVDVTNMVAPTKKVEFISHGSGEVIACGGSDSAQEFTSWKRRVYFFSPTLFRN